MDVIGKLKADPEFQTFSPATQIEIAGRFIREQVFQDPEFLKLPPLAQEIVIRREAVKAGTFNDKALELEMNEMASGIVEGASGSEKESSRYRFWSGIMRGSGALGILENVFQGPGRAQMLQADRNRSLDYLRAVDNVANRSDSSQSAAEVLGFLADIAIVSGVTAPITAAARTAVQAIARGTTNAVIKGAEAAGQAAIATAKAAGATRSIAATAGKVAVEKALPPLIKPALSFYGPIATEALIEAVPYFFTSEQQKKQTGQVTSASQGIGEVAKTLGLNAASDFAIGTLATSLLSLAARTGKRLFSKNEIYQQLDIDEKQWNAELERVKTGTYTPETTVRMLDIDKDKMQNKILYSRYQKDPSNGDMMPKERAAFFGVHSGMIWGQVDEAGVTKYRAWEFDKKTDRPIKKMFDNFVELEDHIAYRYYDSYAKSSPEVKEEFTKHLGAYMLPRGELLHNQAAKLTSSNLIEADEKLIAMGKNLKPARSRIVMTRAEVDALASDPNVTVTPAKIDLGQGPWQNATKAEFSLLKSTPVRRVTTADDANVMFLGVSRADDALFEDATKKAQQLQASGMFPTVEEARASILMTKGFDHYRYPDGSVEYFNTRSMRLIGSAEDVGESIRAGVKVGSVSQRAIIEESGVLTRKVSDTAKEPSTLIDSATTLVRSNMDEAAYHAISKAFLENKGVLGKTLVVRKGDVDSIRMVEAGDTISLYVPKTAPVTFADEKRVVTSFLESLQDIANKYGTARKAPATYWSKRVSRADKKFVLEGIDDPELWSMQAVQKLGGRIDKQGTRYLLHLSSGDRIFENAEDLSNYVARRVMDHSTMTRDLAKQGIRLTRSSKGVFYAKTLREGKVLAIGDLDEVLDALDYSPSSLDISYGPRVVSIDADGVHLEWTGQTVTKNQRDAFQLLSKFEDQAFFNKSMNEVANDAGTIDFTPRGTYYVRSLKWAMSKEFDSLGEARKWLEQPSMPIDEISQGAEKKFLDFYVDRGQYVIKARDKTYRVNTIEEAQTVLQSYPDIEMSAPNLLDVDLPGFEATVSDIVTRYKAARKFAGHNKYNLPPEWPAEEGAQKPLSSYMALRSVFSEMNAWIEDVANRINNPELRRQYLALEEGHRRATREHYEVARMLDSVFRTGKKRKMMPLESRQKIYYYLSGTYEGTRPDLAEQYFERYGKELGEMTPEELEAAGRIRELTDALSVKFNIDARKLLYDYMPQLREFRDELARSQDVANMSLHDLVVKKWGDTPPKELKFWAENERVDEVARFWVKDDPLEVMLLYSAQGHKKLYLNEQWKQFQRFAEGVPGRPETRLEKTIRDRMDFYRMQIMGSYHTNVEKAIEEFGSKFFAKIARGPLGKMFKMNETEMADKGRSLLQTFAGLTYFSTMGWKPFLAIRNAISGPMVGVAGRFGLDWTLRAWDDIVTRGDEYIKYLREIGVVSAKPPIVNLAFAHQTRFGRFMEKSMEWFKNSDDLTRAIAYRTAEMRFENAHDLLKRGDITTRARFEDHAGLDVMEPELREAVWAKIGTPSATDEAVRQAKYEYASRMTLETQFQYEGTNAPMMFKGAIGKVAGQYGTFAAGYRANLMRMFKYASPAKRALMITRYLAVTSACWATFESMGIRTNDFVPVVPSIFTGGPLFDLAIDAWKSTDVSTYEGEQARQRLKYNAPRLLPGASQASYLGKMGEYADKGDSYGAMLSLFSIPYNG